ncbi:HYPK UBA domain-containing protein [Microdochium nivale]|nr:HYPK UBA domain-containing protein [Microdochium nivale]
MAEPQPSNVKEGATGEIEDEVQATAKSAEDRKAAAAMASMDARDDSAGGSGAGSASVDQEAVSKAMKNLGGGGGGGGAQEVNKKVKVDAADVALLVDELDMTKPKATALLKANEGDAVKAMKAYIAV